MTFYDGEEKNRDIIKNFVINNKYIEVNYLFNDNSIIYNYSKEKENEITRQMIEQMLKRDEELFVTIKKDVKIHSTQMLLNLLSIIFCLKGNLQLLFCLAFLTGIIASINLSESYEKYKEMKKFRLYNSLKEILDKPENADITKIIEYDPLYREPINIGTLDHFTYNDVKLIKKELKKRENIKGKEQII